MTKLELTEEERRTLLRLVRDALDAMRFPLSPEAERLRALAGKLRDKTVAGTAARGSRASKFRTVAGATHRRARYARRAHSALRLFRRVWQSRRLLNGQDIGTERGARD